MCFPVPFPSTVVVRRSSCLIDRASQSGQSLQTPRRRPERALVVKPQRHAGCTAGVCMLCYVWVEGGPNMDPFECPQCEIECVWCFFCENCILLLFVVCNLLCGFTDHLWFLLCVSSRYHLPTLFRIFNLLVYDVYTSYITSFNIEDMVDRRA